MSDFFNLDKLNIFFLKVMVFLFPLFFLPATPYQLGMDNYSRYILLSVFVSVFLLFASISLFKGYKLYYRKQRLEFSLFLLLAVFFLSSVFGVNKFVSLNGSLENTILPFSAMVFFVIFYFVLVGMNLNYRQRISLIRVLFLSFAILTFISFLVVYFFGGSSWSVYYRLIAGNQEDLALTMALIIISLTSLSVYKSLYREIFPNIIARTLANLILILAIFVLIKTNFYWAWIALLIFSFLIIILRYLSHKRDLLNQGSGLGNVRKFLLPVLLLLISVNYLLNFYMVYGSDSLSEKLKQYRQLDWSQTYQITRQAIVKKPLLGVGLENFDYAFSKYRPSEMNYYSSWDLRYNKSGSFFLNLIIAGGFLGFLAILYFLFVLSREILRAVKIGSDENEKKIDQLLSLIILYLLFVFVIYSANALFLFLFVIFSAFLMGAKDLKSIDISRDNKLYIYAPFAFLMIFVLVYLSNDIKYAIADAGMGYKDLEQKKILNSVKLSPKRYQYNIKAANIYVDMAVKSINSGDLELASQQQREARRYILEAKKLGVNSVQAQEKIAMFFRDLPGSEGQNKELVRKAFFRAHELEPSNPVILTELGKANIELGNTEEAIANFEKAKALKEDYLSADLGLARAYAKMGQYQRALEILDSLESQVQDVSIYYEIGLVYYNQENYERAQEAFSKAVTISPLHSNSLYGLGLTLEKMGDIDQALFYYKKIQRLNPGNLEIAEKIKELET